MTCRHTSMIVQRIKQPIILVAPREILIEKWTKPTRLIGSLVWESKNEHIHRLNNLPAVINERMEVYWKEYYDIKLKTIRSKIFKVRFKETTEWKRMFQSEFKSFKNAFREESWAEDIVWILPEKITIGIGLYGEITVDY